MRIMSRRPDFSDLMKKFWLRLKVLLIILVAWLVVDEYLKEGYFFDIGDIPVIGTHESFIVILSLIVIAVEILSRKLKIR